MNPLSRPGSMPGSLVIKRRGGGERTLLPGKWFVNRNTPVGDDADFYETKPHNGARWIHPRDIIGKVTAQSSAAQVAVKVPGTTKTQSKPEGEGHE